MHRSSLLALLLLVLAASGCAARVDKPATPGAPVQTTAAGVTFDTEGVDFRPWIRPFIKAIKKQWKVPRELATHSGRVVVAFQVTKDGSIQAATIKQACGVEAFNKAALNSVISLKRTAPLPREYPRDHADFVVTFYYNQEPDGQR